MTRPNLKLKRAIEALRALHDAGFAVDIIAEIALSGCPPRDIDPAERQAMKVAYRQSIGEIASPEREAEITRILADATKIIREYEAAP